MLDQFARRTAGAKTRHLRFGHQFREGGVEVLFHIVVRNRNSNVPLASAGGIDFHFQIKPFLFWSFFGRRRVFDFGFRHGELWSLVGGQWSVKNR